MNAVFNLYLFVIITDGENHEAHHDQVASRCFLSTDNGSINQDFVSCHSAVCYALKRDHVNWMVLVSYSANL